MNSVDGAEVLKEEELAILERSITTVEEVIDFIQREQLSPTDSVLYIMRNSVNVQRIATLQQLHNYCDTSDAEVARLLRTLCVSIAQYEPAVQVAAAQGIRAILKELSPMTVMAGFHALQDMIFNVAPFAKTEWQDTYLAIVRMLPEDPLQLYAVEFVETLSASHNLSDKKIFACKLAAAIQTSPSLKDGGQQSPILHKLLTTASLDSDPQVRHAAADNLAAIARHITCLEFRERTLPIALRLLLDDDVRVSAACFTQLVQLAASFNDRVFVQTFLLPVFLRFANHAPPFIEEVVFREFGRLMWNTRQSLAEADLDNFVNIFTSMCSSQADNMRIHATFNLPAVAACVSSSPAVSARLIPLVESLSRDPSAEVRLKLAAGFHELLPLINGEFGVFEKAFLRLLADSDVRVRERLVSHLDAVLGCFSRIFDTRERRTAFATQLAPLITNYESAIAHNWRKLDTLVKHYELFPDWFPVTELHRGFIPILTQHLAKGAAALNQRLASTIAQFLSISTTNAERAMMLNTLSELVQYLSYSKSHAARIGFIDLCDGILDRFSSVFFDEFLMPALLRLRDDPVSNVRLRLLRLLPRLRSIPRFTQIVEAKFFAKLEAGTERDPDVKRTYQSIKLLSVSFNEATDAARREREGDLQSAEMAKLRLQAQQEALKEDKERAAAAAASKRKAGGTSLSKSVRSTGGGGAGSERLSLSGSFTTSSSASPK